ncbi:MAG: hypothetical protein ABR564_05360 [Candidatus Dormibacteria bacterium]
MSAPRPSAIPLVDQADVSVFTRPESTALPDALPIALDPRQLVAGLLDRWERSVEQRIQVEQLPRFEAQIVERQVRINELEKELRAVRLDGAAALTERGEAMAERERAVAERDRAIADRDRALAERERALSERDRALADRERDLMEIRQEASRRRGLFFRR